MKAPNKIRVICGDTLDVLRDLPSDSIDCCMASPPYWTQREYSNGGIGHEVSFTEYIDRIRAFALEIKRVLTPTGSLCLNVGGVYRKWATFRLKESNPRANTIDRIAALSVGIGGNLLFYEDLIVQSDKAVQVLPV